VYFLGPKNLHAALVFLENVPVAGPWLRGEVEAHVQATIDRKVGGDGIEKKVRASRRRLRYSDIGCAIKLNYRILLLPAHLDTATVSDVDLVLV